MSYEHTRRVTGVLLNEGKLLIVKQRVSESRKWSLPGGKLERGETIEEGLLREMREETGLAVRLIKQLYLCDKTEDGIIHITFLLETDALDGLKLPTNELETTPILDIAFVAPQDLPQYGFTQRWTELVLQGFPDAPKYAGHKRNIGLQ